MFVAYRRRRADGGTDRIWRFYPDIHDQPITNKTEIVEEIRFPRTHEALDRFGDPSLRRLRDARLAVERELMELEARQRTLRMTGPARKAFQLAAKLGRSDLDNFLQTSWQKPAVQRRIRRIKFKDEAEALRTLEDLVATFGEVKPHQTPEAQIRDTTEIGRGGTVVSELPPLPPDHDPSLELVCWTHIVKADDRAKSRTQI